MTEFDTRKPPAHASRLLLGDIPAGARKEYVARYKACVGKAAVAVLWLTPGEARYILGNWNTKNRRLTGAWSRVLEAIQRGGWWPNGEAVVFDTAGRLINGQHRLSAIAAGGEPVPVWVIYGIAPEAFATFDQGRKRNAGDVLSILEYESPKVLATALNWVQRWNAGIMHQVWGSLPNDLAGALAETFPDLGESVTTVLTEYRTKLLPDALAAFLHWLFRRVDADAAARFFEAAVNGIGVKKPSHEWLLRKRLGEDFVNRRQTRDQIEMAALCVITFNRVRRADPVPHCLVWRASSAQPFPTID